MSYLNFFIHSIKVDVAGHGKKNKQPMKINVTFHFKATAVLKSYFGIEALKYFV